MQALARTLRKLWARWAIHHAVLAGSPVDYLQQVKEHTHTARKRPVSKTACGR